MLELTSHEELRALPKYDRVAIYLFRNLTQGCTTKTLPDSIPFDRDAVSRAMLKAVSDGVIEKPIANVPDIKYTYDARRDFPAEVEQVGSMTWLQAGKGKYLLRRTRRKNLIDLESLGDPPEIEAIVDQTPPFISGLLGKDEQAVFTRVRNSGVISHFLGFQAMAIQGHHRTSVTYGQIEIDEVQAGIDGEQGTIVPISGKGGQDRLSWSQALNLNTYGVQKAPKPGLAVRSLGLWRDKLDTVWIVEFTPHIDIEAIEIAQVRRFKFRR